MSATEALERRHEQTIVLRPPSGWTSVGLGELWRFRELLFFLTWRDVKVRYKQTILGALWALLQPFMTMIVFTFVFNHIGKIRAPAGIPYPLFALSGLAFWFYFTNSVNTASGSLVANAPLITKVYFPRLAVAISPLLAGIVDLALSLVLVAGVMAYYGFAPGPELLLLPAFLLLVVLTALGVGLVLSALNVKYRDIRYVVPFVMQLWLYASPVAYPSSFVHGTYRTLYDLNPMTGVIDGFRWTLLGVGAPHLGSLLVSIGAALVLVVLGSLYFARTERSFADVI
jgi:lipopolysaccharide transport system permease protein